MLVKKLGIADMITDKNCYIKDLMDKAIGSPDLLENLPTSIVEQFGPERNEQEEKAIAQTEQITADEIIREVHDPVIAKIVGQSIVKNNEDIEEVASRPVFIKLEIPKIEDITPDSPYTSIQVTLANNGAELIGSPSWEEVSTEEGDEIHRSGWRQWYREPDIIVPTTTVIQVLYWNSGLQDWTVTRINENTIIPAEVSSLFSSQSYYWTDNIEHALGFRVDVDGVVDLYAPRNK